MKEDVHMKENCIFCKITNGEIPSATILENEDFRVILDVSPATKGHALVIPKGHFENIFDLDEAIASKLFVVAQSVAKAMKIALQCEGLNIVQNNGEIAGQTVNHFHLHLIPRYQDDLMKMEWKHLEVAQDQLSEIASSIQKIL